MKPLKFDAKNIFTRFIFNHENFLIYHMRIVVVQPIIPKASVAKGQGTTNLSIFHHATTFWGVTNKTFWFYFSCLDHTLLGLPFCSFFKESSWHFGCLSRISFCLTLHGIWLPVPRLIFAFSPAFLIVPFSKHALECMLSMWVHRMLLQYIVVLVMIGGEHERGWVSSTLVIWMAEFLWYMCIYIHICIVRCTPSACICTPCTDTIRVLQQQVWASPTQVSWIAIFHRILLSVVHRSVCVWRCNLTW